MTQLNHICKIAASKCIAASVHCSRGAGIYLFKIAVAAVLSSLLPQTLCAQPAVAYGLNSSHNGAVNIDGFTLTPTKLWSTNLGGSLSYPLIADGKIFVTGVVTGAGMKLYALNAQSGQVAWSAGLIASSPIDMPTYDNGKVFVFDSNFAASKMNAYDAATGALLWSSPLVDQSSFNSPPTAKNGIVYMGGSGSGGTLYAFRQTDGALLWTQSVHAGSHSSPVVTDEGVYMSGIGPQVYKFNPMNGSLIWHFDSDTSGGGGRSLSYSNGNLFVRGLTSPSFGTNEIAALNATTGQLLTSFQTGAPSLPAISAGLGFTENQGTLIAFNSLTGTPLWSKTNPGDAFVTAPIVINETVFEGTSSGKIFQFNAQSGAQLGIIDVGQQMFRPDEQNQRLLSGLGAGDGLLVVPAGGILTTYAIPEPSTFALLAFGAAGICLHRVRRSHFRLVRLGRMPSSSRFLATSSTRRECDRGSG